MSPKSESKEINAAGTAVWHLNSLRSDLLPNLLDDLSLAERQGLIDDHCTEVKRALARVVHAATSIPDGGFWTRAIWAELQEFEELYTHWNSASGDHAEAHKHRSKALRKMRKQRHRIAQKIRKHQHILANELDLKLLTASHDAMADLVRAVPGMFKELGKAVRRYARKKAML